ncbi:MAG: prenyltransferase, partial [Nocardioides sp.]
MPTDVPSLEGLLTASDVRATARAIVAAQEPSGAIPWCTGEHTDAWNHVESAMALLAAGEVEAAERGYAWVPTVQREDGSVPLKIVQGQVEDASGETNMSSYLAVGVWHHWLVRRDLGFVRRMWPVVRRGLDYAVSMQLPWGGVAWSQEWHEGRPATVNREALLAGSSSIHHALQAGVALADLLGDPQPEWELAGGRLAHAIRQHPDRFLDKSEFSMDWYYPVLGGVVRGEAGRAMVGSRWGTFVEPGLGIRCVSRNPWVTGAETCELVLALDALGDRERAVRL